VLATNTSGLSIESLAQSLPWELKARFLGIHFFNPPRYMRLVEFIPNTHTHKLLLEQLEEFFVVRLGKGVVYAKDTPNFIGNRIGVFSVLSILRHADNFRLAPDKVDALTGLVIGRPKSATCRTMDIVGLDVMRHVVQTMQKDLKEDPWHSYFQLPAWVEELINRGSLGQKSCSGIYEKVSGNIQVFDASSKQYRPIHPKLNATIAEIVKLPWALKLKRLYESAEDEAQFLWCCFRDLFHYSAYHLREIADSTRDVDLTMRWGYGWNHGPFEIWQQAGVSWVKDTLNQEIMQGKTVNAQLPAWLSTIHDNGFYTDKGAFGPSASTYIPRSKQSFYQRQLSHERFPGEAPLTGRTIFENDGVVMWTIDDKFAIVSFKSKKNSISHAVLEGIHESLERAEKEYQALIIWQRQEPNFSVGANLQEILQAAKTRKFETINALIQDFQHVASKLKFSEIPIVAAIEGLCLGGGTEFALHAYRRVAHFESYIGLPEAGIGLIPAGGGCKEMLLRANQRTLASQNLIALEKIFFHIAKSEISSNAKEARMMWYLDPADSIVMNAHEVLYEALRIAQSVSGPNYQPPIPAKITVAGKEALANLQAILINLREGNFISDHDLRVGNLLAKVCCGGVVDTNSVVDEKWLLDLERNVFMELVESELSLLRIEHILSTGKPLRN
ncbi:MAG TPA: enoyl-CoA hydratase-related protein, partial [Gammaproteobacteria bacterium]|nr:enoyl-CoA hydratase-related protein [Gammaproteobacteria bacterium]